MKICRSLAVGLLVAAVLVASGCSKLKQSNRLPEVKSFRFEPAAVMPGDSVTAVVTGTDKDSDQFEVEYEWQVDGKKVPGTTEKLQTTGYPEGARVTVRFRLKEVTSGRFTDWIEKTIVLGATAPPTLKGVTIEPIPLGAGQDVKAVIDYGDNNSSDFTLYYKWSINGQEMEGDQYHNETLDGKYIRKGDTVQLTVGDSEDFTGMNWQSPTVTASGHPPVFSTEPYIETEGKVVYIRYEVEDPDGDEVKVSISGAPAGTTQEKNAFRLNLQGAAPGEYNMTITAVDDTGAGASYEVNLTVPESGAPAVQPVQPTEQPTEQPAYQPEQPAAQPAAQPAPPEPPAEPPAEQPTPPPPYGGMPYSQPAAPAPTAGGSE